MKLSSISDDDTIRYKMLIVTNIQTFLSLEILKQREQSRTRRHVGEVKNAEELDGNL